jgi:DNA helicase HerA-like ATPase
MREYGRIVKSLSERVTVMASDAPLPKGEYVELRYRIHSKVSEYAVERRALGVVSGAVYEPAIPGSPLSYTLPQPVLPETAKLAYTTIYVIAEINGDRVGPPRHAIPPDTYVYRASTELLELVYGGARRGVRIGSLALLDRRVEVRVDPNKLAKHLLIAGATGSGKSNTVAILADRLSAMGAPVIIFDVHGEYNITPEDGNFGKVKVIDAMINPLTIPPRMLATMIIPDAKAYRQKRLLYPAIKDVIKAINDRAGGSDKSLADVLREMMEEERSRGRRVSQNADSVEKALLEYLKDKIIQMVDMNARRHNFQDNVRFSVIDKVEEFFEETPMTLTGSLNFDQLEPGKIYVVNASMLDDDQRRWLLKTLVDRLLFGLKLGRLPPLVLVVEEALLFLGADVSHPVKRSLQKFAREGRKFGGCLVVVSQRPRSLDVNVVSQLQNFVFLRMVQAEDIRTVMNIADNLDEDLARIIPSLPDGRAIVMGEWIGRFPALMDIDLHRGKRVGATPPLVEKWEELMRREIGEFNLEL